MELADYEPWYQSLVKKTNYFLSSRGKQATQSADIFELEARRQVGDIDYYNSLPTLKRKLFYQTTSENFQTNLVRVGLFGILEKLVFHLPSLSTASLNLFDYKAVAGSLKGKSNYLFGTLKGNGLHMTQFYFTHAVAANWSQTVNQKTGFVQINPIKYFATAFIMNLLAFPLAFSRLHLYENPNSTFRQALSTIGKRFKHPDPMVAARMVSRHINNSFATSGLICGLAYFGSKDFSIETLALLPLTGAYYMYLISDSINFRAKESIANDHTVVRIAKSNAGRSLFAVLLLINVFAGYRYAGFSSHDRINEDYTAKHEIQGMFAGYMQRTKHFRESRRYNSKV